MAQDRTSNYRPLLEGVCLLILLAGIWAIGHSLFVPDKTSSPDAKGMLLVWGLAATFLLALPL